MQGEPEQHATLGDGGSPHPHHPQSITHYRDSGFQLGSAPRWASSPRQRYACGTTRDNPRRSSQPPGKARVRCPRSSCVSMTAAPAALAGVTTAKAAKDRLEIRRCAEDGRDCEHWEAVCASTQLVENNSPQTASHTRGPSSITKPPSVG